ncbi:c-type cytochrome [Edaphobacter flagellatus]|uniref:c-type cytochrome n=1 Tax=Edaphobacter flagellatus TaxID=1933044 RepID=UPI0021B3FE86|nr:c-type cytochrome [Edaphobacter flagellatus]
MSRSLRLPLGKAVSLAGALLLSAAVTGCRQDMHDQPKFFPQRGTSFYADGRSVRPQVVNTVARSQAETASYFTTGLVNGAEGDGMPFKVTLDVLERGQERYNIYCTPCHSRVGNGKGMVVERGYYPATSFHSYRLRQAPLGHFFSVITNGYGAMPDYAAQIRPEDRWAIAAYIRALQLSQNAASSDVPSGAHVVPIAAVEESTGFSRDFLGAWLGSSSTSTSSAPAVSAPATTPAATTDTAKTAIAAAPLAPATATKPGSKNVEVAGIAKPAAPQAAGAAPAAEAPAKGDAVHGKAVYAANCSVCHQPTRAGMPPVFPSLIGVVDRVGEKRVRTVAKEGIPDAKPPMPPHPDLTDKDISDLIAFLKTKP